ncbi:hypothetical protein [Saccharopolyspora spinosa]|uniref:hypothetical protein n=1 Tax=Saccharopolyspora spinosa TaxID=60894 RepID=UPI00374A2B71
MSAMASLAALGTSTADGVSVGVLTVEAGGVPGAGRVLPTRTELAAVLPWPGLRRGSTVAVHGSVSLLFALLSKATANGSWAAVVGLSGISLVAAAEAGVELARLAVVPRPGGDPVGVIAALLDGVDLVAVGGTRQVADSDARRLSARARNRGSVLLPFGPWSGAEVQLRCADASWQGLGQGHGYLRERAVTVRAGGRGAASRPRSCRLLLPARDGTIGVPADEPDEVVRPQLRPVAG